MKINLTNKQYVKLIKLLYIGDWVITSHRDADDEVKEFTGIEEYMYSFYKDLHCEELIEQSDGTYYPTSILEESVEEYIEEYDEDTFWSELMQRLTQREMLRKYGRKRIEKMSVEELIEKQQPIEEKYHEEIHKNGLENMEIKGL